MFKHILLLCSLIPFIACCGNILHNDVGRRAADLFNDDEFQTYYSKYPEAFLSATVFPDWGYPWDETKDAAEDAHWPPFMRTMAKHIQDRYYPYEEHAQKLIVFYYGIMSHAAADVAWHSLANVSRFVGQGFIESQSHHIFDDNYQTSHTIADIGGEFILGKESKTEYLNIDWYIPLSDLVEVYKERGFHKVTESQLFWAMKMLYGLTHAANQFADILYPLTVVSPFLQEKMYDFFSGGVDDMVYWNLDCWKSSKGWLINMNGTKQCGIFLNSNHNPRFESHHGYKKRLFMNSFWRKSIQWVHDQMTSEFNEYGAVTFHFEPKYPFDILEEDILSLIEFHCKTLDASRKSTLKGEIQDIVMNRSPSNRENGMKEVSCSIIEDLKETTSLLIQSNHSYLGHAIEFGDFNADGIQDLVMSAPGYSLKESFLRGAVFIVPSSLLSLDIVYLDQDRRVKPFYGPSQYARYGDSIAVVDLNRDGFDDLVISAPRVGGTTLQYRGQVDIYYGSRDGLSKLPDVSIVTSDKNAFSNIGAQLKGFDIDGDGFKDLIIGSPYACHFVYKCNTNDIKLQRGGVSIFLSSRWSKKPVMRKTVDIYNADWEKYGDHSYGWFGYSVELFKGNDEAALIISAPTAHTKQGRNSGTISRIPLRIILNGTSTYHAYTFNGEDMGKFGFHLSAGNPFSSNQSHFLAVSIPTTTNNYAMTGSVLYLDDRMNTVYRLNGDTDQSRFGYQTLMADLNGDSIDESIISSPWHSNQQGYVQIWKGGTLKPNISPSACLTTRQQISRFGSSIKEYKFKNSTYIAIGSPLYSNKDFQQSGAVHVIRKVSL